MVRQYINMKIEQKCHKKEKIKAKHQSKNRYSKAWKRAEEVRAQRSTNV